LGDPKKQATGFVCPGNLLESSINHLYAARKALDADFFNFQKEIWIIYSPAAQNNFFQVFSISKPGDFAAESILDKILDDPDICPDRNSSFFFSHAQAQSVQRGRGRPLRRGVRLFFWFSANSTPTWEKGPQGESRKRDEQRKFKKIGR
jgi:hypothetical protein